MLYYTPEQRTHNTVDLFSTVAVSQKSGLTMDQVNELARLMIKMDRGLKLGFSRELVAATLQSKEMMSKYYFWVEVDPLVAQDVYENQTGRAVGWVYRKYLKGKIWIAKQSKQEGDAFLPEEIYRIANLPELESYENIVRKDDSLRWRKPVMDDIGYKEFMLASGRKNRSM